MAMRTTLVNVQLEGVRCRIATATLEGGSTSTCMRSGKSIPVDARKTGCKTEDRMNEDMKAGKRMYMLK